MNAIQHQQKPFVVVVGVDYSELGDLALERACEFARAHKRTQLHVVHVETAAAMPYGFQGEALAIDFSRASAPLKEHVGQVIQLWCDAHGSSAPFERLTTHVRADGAAEAIAQLASDVEADLVVVGTHGRRGARRFLLGSVAEGTVRLAPCAVLVVRPPDATVPKIEPPCPRCLEIRRATNGKEFWCDQHQQHHELSHTYHFRAAADAHQSSFLIRAD